MRLHHHQQDKSHLRLVCCAVQYCGVDPVISIYTRVCVRVCERERMSKREVKFREDFAPVFLGANSPLTSKTSIC